MTAETQGRKRHPNAKDALRERARELRGEGRTYDEIQQELGCSKSSISLWVRDLPRPAPRHTPEEQRALMNEGLRRFREAREERRRTVRRTAHEEIGGLSDRELFLVGVALYWAEGQKSKSYARRERVIFVNSDPDVILVFQAWLRLLGVEPDRVKYRVMIHQTADIPGAERFWADAVGTEVGRLQRTTIKKHNPRTVRKNVGDGYRGCLVVVVANSADVYCRIEGWWSGIVALAPTPLR
ncbi:hypothetical protein ABZZ44_23150 [Streptomyces sp. NPDC006460]|uniref:hypothetical protein n=1 Tax=Streptomyces sp. NPDC006460 TaxID=3154304 RepID=UPI0033A3094D